MRNVRTAALPIFLVAAILMLGQAKPSNPATEKWTKFNFLLGTWVGSAKDTPHGAGSGGFSFELQLNQNVIVRKNHAEYSNGVKHEDLMIVYLDAGDKPRAIYFDSEGHVIRYAIETPAGGKVVFESEASEPGPRYRLTYWLDRDTLNGKFEIAQPNAEYKTYLEWTSKRV